MGTECNQEANPNYSNVCTDEDHTGQYHTIPGLCVPYPSDPETAGQEYCHSIGFEWIFNSIGDCPCFDHSITCQRNTFDGNPQACCLNNYDSTKVKTDCFSDTAQKSTCAPEFRGVSRSGCREMFQAQCIDSDPNTYYKTWTNNGLCEGMVSKNLYNPNGTINIPGMQYIQSQLRILIDRFFAYQGGIKPIGSADKFQQYLYELCLNNPQACTTGLSDLCSQYTRESLEGSPNTADFCGCHMIASAYAVYANQYGVGKECDPLCSRSSTIPSTNVNGIINSCTSNICIIDEVTLNFVNSDVGDINFAQACGGCTNNATCNCTIADLSLTTVEVELGDVNLNNYCQGSVACYRTNPEDPNGPAIEVDCSYPDEYLPPSETSPGNPVEIQNPAVAYTIIGIIGLVVLIAGILIVFVALKPKPTPKVVVEETSQVSPVSGEKV